jgi:hypothetical protein
MRSGDAQVCFWRVFPEFCHIPIFAYKRIFWAKGDIEASCADKDVDFMLSSVAGDKRILSHCLDRGEIYCAFLFVDDAF